MKTLLFFTVSYPFGGSSEAFIESEIPFLAKEFEKIIVIPKNYYASRTLRPVPENIEVLHPLLHTNNLKRILRGLFNFSPVKYFLNEFFESKVYKDKNKFFWWFVHSLDVRALLSSKEIESLFEKYPDSIWYFYWGRGTSYILPFFKHKKNKKIVRFHRTDLYDDQSKLSFRKQLFDSLDYAVCISEDGKNYITSKYPEFSRKVMVSRLGTRDYGLSRFSTDGIFRILTCSLLIKRKRIDLFVDALKFISSDIQIHWTHIGGGEEYETILKMCQMLPSNITYKFTGNLQNSDVLQYYQTNFVDLFVNISSSEGIPVSIMEALSFGIPIIATNVGGNKEIVDESVGILLSESPSAHQIADAIVEIKKSNTIEIRKNARNRWSGMYDAEKNYSTFSEFLGKNL